LERSRHFSGESDWASKKAEHEHRLRSCTRLSISQRACKQHRLRLPPVLRTCSKSAAGCCAAGFGAMPHTVLCFQEWSARQGGTCCIASAARPRRAAEPSSPKQAKNVETGVAEPPSGINTRGWPEAASPTLPVLLGRPCQSSFALPEKAMHTDVAEPPRSIGRLEESVSLAKQSLQAFLASKNHRASRSASLSGELHGMDSIIQDADEVRRPLLQANAYRKEKIQRGKEYTSRLTVCTESSRDQAFIPAYASVASSRWCQVLFGILASLLFLSKALGCTAPASP